MRALIALVVTSLSAWVRPHRTQLQAWTSDETEGQGRFVFHAVVARPHGHVWGRGWFASRAEAQSALAGMIAECRNRDWGLKNSSVTSARVVRAWRGEKESDACGGDWHVRLVAFVVVFAGELGHDRALGGVAVDSPRRTPV